jgi:xylulokinase
MLLGIDIGTQSLKVLVLDDGLRPAGEASSRYDTSYPRPGWAQQDANDWLAALGPTIAAALDDAGCAPASIRAIGIGGQLDGCVPTDALGSATGPAIVWMDRRADAAIDGRLADLVRARTGLVPDGTHMAAKIAWVQRQDRAVAARTAVWHQPVSFIVAALTGANVMDEALASTTMLAALGAPGWDEDLCAAFEIDAARLPAIAPAGAVAGTLSERGARLTGLPASCRVAVGSGDDFTNPVGSGIGGTGVACVTLGTGEVVSTLAATPVCDAAHLVETRCFPTGHFQLGNPGWLSGGAVRWLREVLAVGDDAQLHALAADAPVGCDGVLFFPGLSGAMSPVWDATARASFYGMTSGHGRAHLARALLEGNAFAMRDVLARLAELGAASSSIRLVGGGAHSALWAQMRADISGIPVAALSGPDASALGAGVLAAVADGRFASVGEAIAALPVTFTSYEPRTADRAAYDDAYGRYRLLFERLQPVFGQLLPGAAAP